MLRISLMVTVYQLCHDPSKKHLSCYNYPDLKRLLAYTTAWRHDPLFRNSFYLFLTTLTLAGFGFVFWLEVAHLFEPSQLGIASTLLSAMNFITYAALLGFNTAFIRVLPKSKKRNETINTGLVLVLLAGIIVAGIYAWVAPLLAPQLSLLHANWYYAVGFTVLVAGASVNLATDSIFVAYRSSHYNLLVDGIIAGVVQVVLPILLVSLGAFGIFASSAAALGCALVTSIYILIRKFRYHPHLTIRKSMVQEAARQSLTSYASNLLNILPLLCVPLIIIQQLGEASAGYYYLAFMMANLLYSIAYALNQSVLAEGAYEELPFGQLAKKSAKALLGIMIPASMVFAAIGPYILRLFGKSYAHDTQSLIYLLAASGPFVAMYIFGISMLRIAKKERQTIIANAYYALCVIGFAALWVHKGLSWVGAAWLVGNLSTALLTGMLFRTDARSPR